MVGHAGPSPWTDEEYQGAPSSSQEVCLAIQHAAPVMQHSRAYEIEILVDGSGYLNGLQLGESSDAALFVRRVCPVPSAFIT